jgi:hypothetical protein
MPEWIKPQITQLVDAAPDGPEWLHEIKFEITEAVSPLLESCELDGKSGDRNGGPWGVLCKETCRGWTGLT